MSIGGGVHRAIERACSIDCTAMQIFVKNNMQWFGRPYQPADLAQFRIQRSRCKLHAIFGHTGYLINLAAPPSENREKSLKSLVYSCDKSIDVTRIVVIRLDELRVEGSVFTA